MINLKEIMASMIEGGEIKSANWSYFFIFLVIALAFFGGGIIDSI